MSTPTTNSIGTIGVNTAGLGNVAALIEGTKWDDGGGAKVTLTYSIPSGTAYFIPGYGKGEFGAWYALTSAEIDAVKSALAAWSKITKIKFKKVDDNATVVGDLRFAATDIVSAGSDAHGYYPDNDPSGGDVWFKNGAWHEFGSSIEKGSYDYLTILHEIGHALGLKHTFEDGVTLPAKFDNYSFSVMSYSANENGSTSANYYPTTLMWYDILAVQELYGAGSNKSGNTKYTYRDNKPYWETIYDTGGKDTITYKGNVDVEIDLAIGHWSDLGRDLTFGDGSVYTGTVMIGPDSVIEKAKGGSGNDKLDGNKKKNTLSGGKGDDKLKGFKGSDKLGGGKGDDKLNGGKGTDQYVFEESPTSGVDRITDFQPGEKIRLDNADFSGIGGKGTLKAKYFVKASDARDGNDHVIYTKGAGKVFFDEDGKGGAGKVLFAKVDAGTQLDNKDFLVI
ncbi:MAG: matrixin family metalloprotease [Hyphomicrobiales bacterium]|nr:matrixin family metalloprotease [Hyphomicrobiales bacterium]